LDKLSTGYLELRRGGRAAKDGVGGGVEHLRLQIFVRIGALLSTFISSGATTLRRVPLTFARINQYPGASVVEPPVAVVVGVLPPPTEVVVVVVLVLGRH
jgi:hypothetical protein